MSRNPYRNDAIVEFVRTHPGCTRREVMAGATEWDPRRRDASHAPFYARIKRREETGVIVDRRKPNARNSMLYVAGAAA